MTQLTPRLRMFAGPNGSGKSTLKTLLTPELLGVYLNPDELERQLRRSPIWDLSQYGLKVNEAVDTAYFASSLLLNARGLGDAAQRIRCGGGCIDFSATPINSYVASVAAALLREKLLASQRTFTFETVMSHHSKVDLLTSAQAAGFRTYLYFVATDDPAINVSRVENRVRLGGHDVPHDKIESRYHRSLGLLIDAIKRTNRAYIFDNSGDSSAGDHTWLAEVTDGRTLELKTDAVPSWFKRHLLDKLVEAP